MLCYGTGASATQFVSKPAGAQDGAYNSFYFAEGEPGWSHDIATTSSTYGSLLTISVGPESYVGGVLMHFPLAGAPQQIVSATMRFYGDLPYPSVSVYHIDADVSNDVEIWEIETPQVRVFRFFDANVQPVARWFEVDLTSVVQQDLTLGRAFSAFNFTGGDGRVYLSESDLYAPSLTIIPVPEPAGVVTLVTCCSGLCYLRRWRRL